MNFAFYDLETTGITPAFDHPMQFAAILTDAEFNEIERVNLRCRLAPHIIPSPQALAVTGLRPAQLLDENLPNFFEFTQSLAELVKRWSPVIWTGFNSIRFDEEMLRQAFYQNLQPDIFATQFNGNTRFDIMTAVYAVWCCRPDLFEWPVDEAGKVRFKLDRLAPLNGFEGHNAHDALGDVEATIHIARKIAELDPDLWKELLSSRNKGLVQSLLESFKPLELVGRFGGGPPQITIGCLCGYSSSNPNQAFFFDLDAADPSELITADEEMLAARLEETPRIIRSVSINKSPALLTAHAATEEQTRRASILADAPQFRERLAQVMAARYPQVSDATLLPVEKRIFGGFYNWSDKALLNEFQGADWRHRQEIVSSFEDARLRQLGHRLVAFYATGLLSEGERLKYKNWLQERWNAPDQPETEWMTLNKARNALDELRAGASHDAAMLDEIERFLADRMGAR
ncbi:exodeoxyribonuclease I [Sulfitobacter sp. JBTF-M27]|uniref:Exodeoxyribonuclease I n=1 Tax=Sulfitobacter sediminilitoris TaxID=2698830 RepID=A0A6P0CI67_9RHOB|nr:exodeoxyribonuclease I [Sulfitobacter sediminilitoris]NEK24183.1 exodeoxyribonuclease I [Sulfitobacter sediminilitoris]